ncbi:WD repeat-containing protein 6 [Boothiomyces sp. JEL0866]|nr:WD repeat-containing protein 6 [Boothiomyces sp. JEL0866]
MKKIDYKSQITALKFINSNELLVGTGPFLTKINIHTHEKQELKIFEMARILKIKLQHYTICAGQKSICILQGFEILHLFEIDDWIIDFELHENYLLILTAHNNLQTRDFDGRLLNETKNSARCMLYSGCIYNNSSFSGTIFNQIIHNREKYIGHEGVLFSVEYKDGFILSTSDDRTVRLWNVESNECVVFHGHLGRVWKAIFYNDYIISISEDASCRVWNRQGELLTVWEGHGSRNVWSVDVIDGIVATGGGDGGIRLWNLNELKQNRIDDDSQVQTINLPNVPKSFGFTKELEIVDEMGNFYSFKGELKKQFTDTEFKGHSNIVTISDNTVTFNVGLVLFQTKSKFKLQTDTKIGQIFGFEIENDLIVFIAKEKEILCFRINDKIELAAVLEPVAHFEVFEMKYNGDILVCGSKKGAMCCYQLELSTAARKEIHEYMDVKDFEIPAIVSPCLVARHVHGSDAVTSILLEKVGEKYQISTVGRDGLFNSFLLYKSESESKSKSNLELANGYTLETIHKTRITKGWLEQIVKIGSTIFLAGFFNARFFIFNQSKNCEMFSVNCNAKRVWKLKIHDELLNHLEFAYFKHKHINYVEKITDNSFPDMNLIEPYHSLETRACKFVDGWIVSGGEDSILTFHSYDNKLQRVLWCKKHEASIRCLDYQDGLLFTGGSQHELYCWKLDIQQKTCIQIAQAEKSDTEARIMDLSVHGNYVITANSDSFIRLYNFNGNFDLLFETDYHHKCVQKTSLIEHHNDLFLFSAGTDGRIVKWKVTDKLELVNEYKVHQSGVKAMDVQVIDDVIQIASGGDDNLVSLIIGDTIYNGNYHGSSVTGIHLEKGRMVSVGIDQRLVEYRIDNGIHFVKRTFVDIADISDMDVSGKYLVVVGHGIQLFEQ